MMWTGGGHTTNYNNKHNMVIVILVLCFAICDWKTYFLSDQIKCAINGNLSVSAIITIGFTVNYYYYAVYLSYLYNMYNFDVKMLFIGFFSHLQKPRILFSSYVSFESNRIIIKNKINELSQRQEIFITLIIILYSIL